MKKMIMAFLVLVFCACKQHSRLYTETKIKESLDKWMANQGAKPGEIAINKIQYKDSLDFYSFTFQADVKTAFGDTTVSYHNNIITNDFVLVQIGGLPINEFEKRLKH